MGPCLYTVYMYKSIALHVLPAHLQISKLSSYIATSICTFLCFKMSMEFKEAY